MAHWKNLIDKLYLNDPYIDFDDSKYPLDLSGWPGKESFYKNLIEKIKPNLIIEVGVWKGASVSFMAKSIKELHLNSIILAVDTWLQNQDIMFDKKWRNYEKEWKKVNGYPTLYYQFLANMVKQGFQDIVYPIPTVGTDLAKSFIKNNIKADLIHIDAAHDYESVKRDIYYFSQILSKDGILFGDDYAKGWPGVKQAVNEYVSSNPNINLVVDNKKWIAYKL